MTAADAADSGPHGGLPHADAIAQAMRLLADQCFPEAADVAFTCLMAGASFGMAAALLDRAWSEQAYAELSEDHADPTGSATTMHGLSDQELLAAVQEIASDLAQLHAG
jgi:hypothetical protein